MDLLDSIQCIILIGQMYPEKKEAYAPPSETFLSKYIFFISISAPETKDDPDLPLGKDWLGENSGTCDLLYET